MNTRERKLLKQEEVLGGYDTKDYESALEEAVSHDGTKVPVSLVWKKGLNRMDGSNPMLLEAYGSYGVSSDPSFDSKVLCLLDRGFIYGVAHIRGGGEMGRQWYEDGKLLTKRNTFLDFIASARHLVENKFTSPKHLSITGASAGGLLMGAVMNMAPELFGAIVAEVPFVDAINTMLDPTLPLTVGEYEEWGNPQEKDFFDYMLTYSPYENAKARDYPAMLFTAGLNDPRVAYWEPAKLVAKLRTIKTDKNDLLLKTEMEEGHGGASGRYDFLKEIAFNYAFIIDHVKK
jgi:oligopeptidase B